LDIEAMMKIADDQIYQILHGEMTIKNCVCKENGVLKCFKHNEGDDY
jgi:hypothetical protein